MRIMKNGLGTIKVDGKGERMEKDTVAVVIPVYNSENTIQKVLSSIEAQTARDSIHKVIVINDGSTDQTEKMVKDYIQHSTLRIELINRINAGVSSARNLGMKNAGNAEWIAFCDSDDLWRKNKLYRQMDIIAKNRNIDILGSAFGSRPLRIGMKTVKNLYHGNVKDICIRNFPSPSTVIMKKKIYDEIGGFDEHQRYAEDGNYFLKIAANYNLYYLPEELVDFGFGKRGFGVSGLSGNLKQMYEGNVKNLVEIKKLGYINRIFYSEMRFYFFLKYIRRIIITKLDSKK